MSYVQSTSKASVSGTSDTLTFGSNVSNGHTLIAIIRSAGISDVITGVSDNVNGAWTRIASVNGPSSANRTFVYKKEGVAAGGTTVTLTSSTTLSARWIVAEYTEASIDAINSGTFTTTTNPTSVSVTSTQASDTIVTSVSLEGGGTTIVPASGETERAEVNNDARLQLQDKAGGAAGSYTGSWTLGTTQPGVSIAIAMLAATSTPAPIPPGAKQTFVNTIYQQF